MTASLRFSALALLALSAWRPAEASAQNVAGVPWSLVEEVMPDADRFDDVRGDPPVVAGYAVGPDGSETLIGYVFLTSDLPPEQYGYNGPIEALVGMTLDGSLTGVRVTDYRESYMQQMGDFLRRRGFQEQYRGKYIGDPFRVWGDVDGISRVTISVRALSRGVRDSARRVAMAYAGTGAVALPEEPVADVVGMSWFEMRRRGVVERFEVTEPGEGSAGISLAYIGSERAGEYFLGRIQYESALRSMARRDGAEHIMLYGVDGARLRLFVREGWSLVQDGDTTAIDPAHIVMLGLPSGGVAAGETTMVGVILIKRMIDIRRPFTFVYDMGDLGVHSVEYATQDARMLMAAEAAERQAEEALAAAVEPDPGGSVAGADAPPDPVVSESTASGAGAGPGGATERAPEAGAAREETGSATEPAEAATPPDAGASGIADAPPGEEAGASGRAEAPPTEPTAARARDEAAADARGPEGPGGPAPPADALRADAAAAAAGGIDGLAGDDEDGPSVRRAQSFDFVMTEDESFVERLFGEVSWSRVWTMLFVLGLGLWAFFAKRTDLRWASLAATFFVLGYYNGGFLSVSHITSGIWSGPDVYLRDLPLLMIVAVTLVTTLVWGRVFCGFLCPFGALQDFIDRFVPRRLQRPLPARVHDRAVYVKYVVLGIVVLPAVIGSEASFYQYFEPFGTVFFLSPSPLFWSIAAAFILASVVVPRFYCRYACPLGAALAIGSLVSLRRIRRVEQCRHCKVCEQKCPTGAIRADAIDFKECVRCNVCEVQLLERRGVCRHDMDRIRPRLVQLRTGRTAGVADG